MRFHRLQNVQIALDFLKQRQVRADKSSSSRAGWVCGVFLLSEALEGVNEQRQPVLGCARLCVRMAFRGLFPVGCCASENHPRTQKPAVKKGPDLSSEKGLANVTSAPQKPPLGLPGRSWLWAWAAMAQLPTFGEKWQLALP